MNRSFAALLGFGMASTMAMSGSNDGSRAAAGGHAADKQTRQLGATLAEGALQPLLARAEHELHCFYNRRYQPCDLQASR